MALFVKYLSEEIPYTGIELRPHWIAEYTGIFSDAIVSFCGPCQVKTESMVDVEDVLAGSHIRSAMMLHFLGEFFENDLNVAIYRQRLFILGFAEILNRYLPQDQGKLYRKGNDLFWQQKATSETVSAKKLTVSIVTSSPVSTLFHFGVNIDASGSPVPAIGLKEWQIPIEPLAQEVLQLWEQDCISLQKARAKVRARI